MDLGFVTFGSTPKDFTHMTNSELDYDATSKEPFGPTPLYIGMIFFTLDLSPYYFFFLGSTLKASI